jgi:hypothetical protein
LVKPHRGRIRLPGGAQRPYLADVNDTGGAHGKFLVGGDILEIGYDPFFERFRFLPGLVVGLPGGVPLAAAVE